MTIRAVSGVGGVLRGRGSGASQLFFLDNFDGDSATGVLLETEPNVTVGARPQDFPDRELTIYLFRHL